MNDYTRHVADAEADLAAAFTLSGRRDESYHLAAAQVHATLALAAAVREKT